MKIKPINKFSTLDEYELYLRESFPHSKTNKIFIFEDFYWFLFGKANGLAHVYFYSYSQKIIEKQLFYHGFK